MSHTIEEVATPSGPISVRCWEPAPDLVQDLVVVTVHPWAPLGGSENNTIGIAEALAAKGLRTLTFNLRSSSMDLIILTEKGISVCIMG